MVQRGDCSNGPRMEVDTNWCPSCGVQVVPCKEPYVRHGRNVVLPVLLGELTLSVDG